MQPGFLFSTLPQSWRLFLGQSELLAIEAQMEPDIFSHLCFPPRDQWFYAFDICPLERCRVVIVGQDPYHGPGQAMGLAFSVRADQPDPPSLRNILKEWSTDLGYDQAAAGDLTVWGSQGVLLLNRVLTVRPGEAGSHRGLGWEKFTEHVVKKLALDETHRIFCLWGGDARRLKPLIGEHHSVIENVHPSPLSAYRGFFGSKPFSKINQLLKDHGQSELDWSLPFNLPSDFKGHAG